MRLGRRYGTCELSALMWSGEVFVDPGDVGEGWMDREIGSARCFVGESRYLYATDNTSADFPFREVV
jgi:hypothetical protein